MGFGGGGFGSGGSSGGGGSGTVSVTAPLDGDGSGGDPLNIPAAGAAQAGHVTTGAQTLAGAKTFSSTIASTVASGSNALSTVQGARLYLGGRYISDLFGTVFIDGPVDVGGRIKNGGAATTLSLEGGGAGTVDSVRSNSNTALTTGDIHVFSNNSTEVLAVSSAGKLINATAGDSSGTPGNATLNTPTGRFAIADTASTATITNSLVSATSIVICQLLEANGAVTVANVVPGAGSFVCNLTAATNGDRTVGFIVLN